MFTCIEFKTVYKGDKQRDMVLLAPVGEGFERTQTWHYVHTLKPADGQEGPMADLMRERWAVVEPAYKAWQAGEAVPENGTALAAWSGVTAEQVKLLRTMGITSVEAVAEMNDSAIAKLPFPNRRELPKLAKTFLERRGEVALAEQLANAQERIAAMEAMLAEKPKRGRPPKVAQSEPA